VAGILNKYFGKKQSYFTDKKKLVANQQINFADHTQDLV
jgi:hypothetical protein